MEHRIAPRVRTVLKAEIRYNDGMMSAPCVVRDLSDSGARLELVGEIALPDHFDLYIEKKHRTFRAALKRRCGREIGVAFKEAGEPKGERPADSEMSERMTKLEGEVAELKSGLAALAAAISRRA